MNYGENKLRFKILFYFLIRSEGHSVDTGGHSMFRFLNEYYNFGSNYIENNFVILTENYFRGKDQFSSIPLLRFRRYWIYNIVHRICIRRG